MQEHGRFTLHGRDTHSTPPRDAQEDVILKNRADLVWATWGERGLVLALAAIGWATNQPLIFASLGPTAYELGAAANAERQPHNVIVGHLIGLGAGFLAIYLSNAWAAPNVLATGVVSVRRMWATTISVALTTFASPALRAGQPAALATPYSSHWERCKLGGMP
jgi:hypothetical protein